MADEGALGADEAVAGGIFPFLSVLICTMGVMVFILVVGFISQSTTMGGSVSERVTVMHESIVGDYADKVVTEKTLSTEVSNIMNAVEVVQEQEEQASNFIVNSRRVDTEIQQAQTTTKATSRKLKELQENETQIRTRIKKYRALKSRKEKAVILKGVKENHSVKIRDKNEVTKKANSLQKDVDDLRAQKKKLEEDLEAPQITFDFRGENLPTPIMIDLRKDTVIVMNDALKEVRAGERKGGPELFGELFEKVAGLLVTGPTKTYALLLVRPDAVETFYEARKAFLKWRAPFRHEPFESDWTAAPLAAAPVPE
jgi:hypothetical protein